jgi:hypothetical protein
MLLSVVVLFFPPRSSFELYREEVMSGNLVWSLVHRSEKFWRENVGRFEENNFKVLGYVGSLYSQR